MRSSAEDDLLLVVTTLAGKPATWFPLKVEAGRAISLAGLVAGFWARFVVTRKEAEDYSLRVRMCGGKSLYLAEHDGLLYAVVGNRSLAASEGVCALLRSIIIASSSAKLAFAVQEKPNMDVYSVVNQEWLSDALSRCSALSISIQHILLDPTCRIEPHSLRRIILKNRPLVISHLLCLNKRTGAVQGYASAQDHPISKDDVNVLCSVAATSSNTTTQRIFLPSYQAKGCFYSIVAEVDGDNVVVILTPRREYLPDLRENLNALVTQIVYDTHSINPPVPRGCQYMSVVERTRQIIFELHVEHSTAFVELLITCLERESSALAIELSDTGTVVRTSIGSTSGELLLGFTAEIDADTALALVEREVLPWAQANCTKLLTHPYGTTVPSAGLFRFFQAILG